MTNYDVYKSLSKDQYPIELEKWYERKTGQVLDLANPKTFNEKLQWLKLNDHTHKRSELSDKFMVRQYIKEKIGDKYLIPMYGHWSTYDDIDFDSLPDRFVLKTNHGSGTNCLIKDKSKINHDDLRKKFKVWLGTNYAFTNGFELQYKNIAPRIIAEQYLDIDNYSTEYTVYCFDGQPKFTQLELERFSDEPTRAIYDNNWKQLPFCMKYEPVIHDIRKPENWNEMLILASRLSTGFRFVRVDFYSIGNQLFFGELTFTSGSGLSVFIPEQFNELAGDLITL